MPNERDVKIDGGLEIFVNFNKQGVKINGEVGKNLLIKVMNEKRDINLKAQSSKLKNKTIITLACNSFFMRYVPLRSTLTRNQSFVQLLVKKSYKNKVKENLIGIQVDG